MSRRRAKKTPKRSFAPPFRSVTAKTAGLPPGSAVYSGPAEPTEALLSLYAYDASGWRMECPSTVGALLEALDPAKNNWINVNGLSGGAVERLGERLGIHPLVVEDILDPGQRPRVEAFEDCIFVVTKMLTLHEGGEIEYEQVSLIRRGNVVVSFQETPGDCFGPLRERIASGAGRLAKAGPDFLLYSLLDLVVDNYFAVLESVGDRLEAFELAAGEARPGRDFMTGLQALKGELIRLRRTLWPVRDSVAVLARTESGHLSELAPFLRDLHENAIQAIEALETYREHAASIMEIYLSSVSNRTNDIMKVLTIMSTIFIPLTFIAGVYGMNFRHMPELEKAWAYPVVWGVMILVALGELVFFKLRKWI